MFHGVGFPLCKAGLADTVASENRFTTPQRPIFVRAPMPQPSRSQILVLPPPSLYRKLFSPSTDARLRGLGDVTFNADERDLASNDLLDRVANVDVLVTGW